MKNYNAVKTKGKAKAIINEYVSDNNLTGGYLTNTNCHCECGETQCITWCNGDVYILVAICDACGNNDTFEGEVLNAR